MSMLLHQPAETPVGKFFKADRIIKIPVYQRGFKWNVKSINSVLEDVYTTATTDDEIHFLGPFITVPREREVDDAEIFEIVDGQQRLTTVFLIYLNLMVLYAENNELNKARSILKKYIIVNTDDEDELEKIESNVKIHPTFEDRSRFNLVMKNLIHSKNKKIKKIFDGATIKLLADDGPKTKAGIFKQNKNVYEKLRLYVDTSGSDILGKIHSSLAKNVTMLHLRLLSPGDANKIFKRLNAYQVPVTIGELIRNEVFSKGTSDKQIERIDKTNWRPFLDKFKEDERLFENFFFPFTLINDDSITKQDTFDFLSRKWSDKKMGPEAIIEDFNDYIEQYLDINDGGNRYGLSKKVSQTFKRLNQANFPSVGYPFLMQLMTANKKRTISDSSTIEINEILESFIVRRSICGETASGLHSVFKTLWRDCNNGKPNPSLVKGNIERDSTVSWPNDDLVSQNIRTRNLASSGIIRHLLIEYEVFIGKDKPANEPTIEHILPQTATKDWEKIFKGKSYGDNLNIWANLIPLTTSLNSKVSCKLYSEKKKLYAKDSVFKTARIVATKYNKWDPTQINKRSAELVSFALKRWPHKKA